VVFLDRDGTINEEVEYLRRIEDLRLIPGASSAIRALNQAGYKIFVVTNQSAIARGFLTEASLHEIHIELEKRLNAEGAFVDGWFYCPHHPSAGAGPYTVKCECRKPGTGMVEKALSQCEQEVRNKFVIGDTLADMQLAENAGAIPVLVKTGHGAQTLEAMKESALDKVAYVAADLLDAANWIISVGQDV